MDHKSNSIEEPRQKGRVGEEIEREDLQFFMGVKLEERPWEQEQEVGFQRERESNRRVKLRKHSKISWH